MSSIKVSNPNNVKIYTVSGQSNSRSIPDWLVRKNKKSLKKDLDWSRRVELIQEFEFPEASLRVRTTNDGNHAVATGVYKPQIRVYEFDDMSLKFERHTDAENINFIILSDDWTKTVHLQADRSIEFHSQSAMHYKTRIPKFGRDLAYHYNSCDLLVVGSSSDIYRINLDQGRFLNPINTIIPEERGINTIDINPVHQLIGVGGDEGTLEFFDPRSRGKVAQLFNTTILDSGEEVGDPITKLKFNVDGLNLAVGTHSGKVKLYDLRNNKPYLIKDHQYDLPIKSLQWLQPHDGDSINTKIVSADAKVVKIWNASNGTHFTSIEPSNDINECHVIPNSGLIFLANEGIQMQSYYIPALGPAPKWCTFLENLTEEMEENPNQTVYDDYKFVTRKDLHSLGLDHLIGSNLLRAYMHGFLMDLRFYEQARLIANPFAYEDYKAGQVTKKLDQTRESRIGITTDLPKVNRDLALKLKEQNLTTSSDAKDTQLVDDRFKDLFEDPDFQVDAEAEANVLKYKTQAAPTVLPSFRTIQDDEDENASSEAEGKGSDDDSDSSDEEVIGSNKFGGSTSTGSRSRGRSGYHKDPPTRGKPSNRGASRGGRGGDRGSSRGGDRGSSRGGSRGSSRGGSRGGSGRGGGKGSSRAGRGRGNSNY